jgi:hypothetical protein
LSGDREILEEEEEEVECAAYIPYNARMDEGDVCVWSVSRLEDVPTAGNQSVYLKLGVNCFALWAAFFLSSSFVTSWFTVSFPGEF